MKLHRPLGTCQFAFVEMRTTEEAERAVKVGRRHAPCALLALHCLLTTVEGWLWAGWAWAACAGGSARVA